MMTSLKTCCLLPLTVLLLVSITTTVTEVVQSMSECKEFLLKETSPQVPDILKDGNIQDQDRYKVICQTYVDKRRFVTLYDTKNKIPVFSAYKYRGAQTGRPQENWMIEPQLEDMKNRKNIDACNFLSLYTNQASNKDYNDDKRYEKGHLFPSTHAFDNNDKISTFTLTNSVPQVPSFNQGSWAKMETCVKCILEKYCKNKNVIEGYVVTGAQPSPDKTLNERVNVPSILWSAFCCYSEEKKKWLVSANWGENVNEPEPKYLQIKSLEDLKQKFSIDVFPGKECPRHETVPAPDLKKFPKKQNCNCPPPTSTS